MIQLKIKRLENGIGLPLPSYATPQAAGMDVVAAHDATIAPGERSLVATGFAMAIPNGYEVQARPRSGLALKKGVTLANSPGTIDSDYRGELKIILINHGEDFFSVSRGDRIAQIIVAPVFQVNWEEVGSLDVTQRNEGGFGSTGGNNIE